MAWVFNDALTFNAELAKQRKVKGKSKMTVLRIRKNANFVVLNKTCTHDATLSLQAKGLHSMLMGFPDDWKIYLKDITNRSTNGRDAVRKAFNELIQAGYISREEIRSGGRFSGYEYFVNEQPDLNPSKITPQPENPSTVISPGPGKPAPGNPTLINNNNTKNKLTNSTVSLPMAEKKQDIVNDELSGSFTENQIRYLKGTFKRLQEQGVAISDPERVFQECAWAILNPEQMKGISSFKHRVNIVSKLLRRKRWLTPKGFNSHSEIGKKLKQQDDDRILGYEKTKLESDSEISEEILRAKNAITFCHGKSIAKSNSTKTHQNLISKYNPENSQQNEMMHRLDAELSAEKRYLLQLARTYRGLSQPEIEKLEMNVKTKIRKLTNELEALKNNNKNKGEKNADVA